MAHILVGYAVFLCAACAFSQTHLPDNNANEQLDMARKGTGANRAQYLENRLLEIDRLALKAPENRRKWRLMTPQQKVAYIEGKQAELDTRRAKDAAIAVEERKARLHLRAGKVAPGKANLISAEEMTRRANVGMRASIDEYNEREAVRAQQEADDRARRIRQRDIQANEQLERARFEYNAARSMPNDYRSETQDELRRTETELNRAQFNTDFPDYAW